jgi:hypothetical protein
VASKPTVTVTITGDEKGLERALNRSSSAMKGFGTTALGVFGGNLLTKGFDVAADAVKGFFDFAKGGIEIVDKLGDSVALLDAQAAGLGKAVDKVDLSKWGVDRSEAAASALAIANTGKSLGLTGGELKKVVPDLTELVAQYSALRDEDPATSAATFAQALKGSSKAAAKLGVELPKGAKGLEAYDAILAQLGPKLDAATSSGRGVADTWASWDAMTKNLQIELGGMLDELAPVIDALMQALMPILRELITTVGPAVKDALSGIATAFTELVTGGGMTGTADTVGKIASIFSRIGAFVFDKLLPAFAELAGAVGKELGPIFDELSTTFSKLMPLIEAVWSILAVTLVPFLRDILIPIVGKLVTLFLKLVGIFADLLTAAIKTAMDWLGKLGDVLRPILDTLGKVAGLIGDVGGAIGGIIPHAASLSAPAGPTATTRLGATAGGGGVSVSISVGVGDPVAIGRQLTQVLNAYGLRGGRLA